MAAITRLQFLNYLQFFVAGGEGKLNNSRLCLKMFSVFFSVCAMPRILDLTGLSTLNSGWGWIGPSHRGRGGPKGR